MVAIVSAMALNVKLVGELMMGVPLVITKVVKVAPVDPFTPVGPVAPVTP